MDERQTMGLSGHHFRNGPVERWLVWLDGPQRTGGREGRDLDGRLIEPSITYK